MLLDSPSPQPVSKRKLQLLVKKPGEVIVLGSHGEMYDFIITAGTAYHGATMIVVKTVASKSAAENIICAENLIRLLLRVLEKTLHLIGG